MPEPRRFADAESLGPVVQAALGSDRHVTEVERLSGGSKKGVYRVVVDDHARVVVYVWNRAEDYWHGVLPEVAEDATDPFSHASGLDLYEAAADRLTAIGVRCPRLLLADGSGGRYPGDVAVVEWVSGTSLEFALEHDPRLADRALRRLSEWLAWMAACRATTLGKVAVVDGGGGLRVTPAPHVVLTRALREVDEISARDDRAAKAQNWLRESLYSLASAIRPRSYYSIVHGELGPDHVLLDSTGEPVLIDIEGLMYFDAEWEHVFLQLRLAGHYSRVSGVELDPDRVAFYRLAQHLDLVAGPLRMADSGHPEHEWFRDLAEYHLREVLKFGPLS